MKTLHLIFNHTLSQKQEEDAIRSLGVGRIVALPDELRCIWSSVSPDSYEIRSTIEPILKYIRDEVQEGDFCLVQGDFGATCLAVQQIWSSCAVPIYATTKRRVVEEVYGNETRKVSLFEHVRFRAYERIGE